MEEEEVRIRRGGVRTEGEEKEGEREKKKKRVAAFGFLDESSLSVQPFYYNQESLFLTIQGSPKFGHKRFFYI